MSLTSSVYDPSNKEIVIFADGLLNMSSKISLAIRLDLKLGKVDTFTISKIDFIANPRRFDRPCYRLPDKYIVSM
jgi:hypothetical protein